MILTGSDANNQTQTENYNEEWGEISLNLTAAEKKENPVQKALRLVKESLLGCASKRDRSLCIMLLVDLDVSLISSQSRFHR